MIVERTVEIEATPERVWSVLTEVERWPEWTASVTRAEVRNDGESLRADGVVRMTQPRMPVLDWTVVEFDPGRSFSWTSRSAGVTTLAEHELVPAGDGRTRVTLRVRHRGVLAPLVGLLTGAQTRRYVGMEAVGLKRRCERPAGIPDGVA